jgi:Tn3 transposase DDE domain
LFWQLNLFGRDLVTGRSSLTEVFGPIWLILENALRRAVFFFNRLGEIRDRSYENQRHRASGLNLLVAAIILWNTTYLQRAVDHLRDQGHHSAFGDLAHLSPLC